MKQLTEISKLDLINAGRIFLRETKDEFVVAKHAVEVTLPPMEEMDPLGVLWKLEEDGWIGAEEAEIKTAELLKQFVVNESGVILQKKPEKPKLLEKKIRTNKQRGKRL